MVKPAEKLPTTPVPVINKHPSILQLPVYHHSQVTSHLFHTSSSHTHTHTHTHIHLSQEEHRRPHKFLCINYNLFLITIPDTQPWKCTKTAPKKHTHFLSHTHTHTQLWPPQHPLNCPSCTSAALISISPRPLFGHGSLVRIWEKTSLSWLLKGRGEITLAQLRKNLLGSWLVLCNRLCVRVCVCASVCSRNTTPPPAAPTPRHLPILH